MTQKKIGVIVGSLRKGSYNRKMALELARLAPPALKLDIIEIGQLSLYNQDLDDDPPEEWTGFRAKVAECDGLLFLTPEYNRSFPGVLKNAIDIGSRPYGKSVWGGKPAAVMSVSISPLGGFGANHHLRQTLVVLNVHAMDQPEAYIAGAANLFDENGSIKEASTREFAAKFIEAFAVWVETISAGSR